MRSILDASMRIDEEYVDGQLVDMESVHYSSGVWWLLHIVPRLAVPSNRAILTWLGKIPFCNFFSGKACYWRPTLHACIGENFSSKYTVVSLYVRVLDRSSVDESFVAVPIVIVWWSRHSTSTNRLEGCRRKVEWKVLWPRRWKRWEVRDSAELSENELDAFGNLEYTTMRVLFGFTYTMRMVLNALKFAIWWLVVISVTQLRFVQYFFSFYRYCICISVHFLVALSV